MKKNLEILQKVVSFYFSPIKIKNNPSQSPSLESMEASQSPSLASIPSKESSNSGGNNNTNDSKVSKGKKKVKYETKIIICILRSILAQSMREMFS